MSFSELLFLYEQNLNSEDYEKIQNIRLLFDIENIRAFWLKEPLNPSAQYDENKLEDAILTGIGFPSYVCDFLAKYDEQKDRLRQFPFLIAKYFNEEILKSEGFLANI